MIAMKCLSFLLPLVPLISGFRIAANTADGVYKTYYDKAGNEVHVLLTQEILANDTQAVFAGNLAVPPLNLSTTVGRTAQDAWRRSFCECNQNLDHSDADDATDRIRDQTQRAGGAIYLSTREGIYGTVNGITAFICTPERNSGVTPVSVRDFDYALGFITEHCGCYVPGM